MERVERRSILKQEDQRTNCRVRTKEEDGDEERGVKIGRGGRWRSESRDKED